MSDMGGDLNPRRRSPSSLPPATPPLDLDAGSAPGTRAVRLCLPGAPGGKPLPFPHARWWWRRAQQRAGGALKGPNMARGG